MRLYMVKVYIKERINDQATICSGGVTGNTTYLGTNARASAENRATRFGPRSYGVHDEQEKRVK